MASAKLLKSLIKPVIERHPNLVFSDTKLFFQPIGWYLRGCMFGKFGWPGGRTNLIFVYRFVIPLFDNLDVAFQGFKLFARGEAGPASVRSRYSYRIHYALAFDLKTWPACCRP